MNVNSKSEIDWPRISKTSADLIRQAVLAKEVQRSAPPVFAGPEDDLVLMAARLVDALAVVDAAVATPPLAASASA